MSELKNFFHLSVSKRARKTETKILDFLIDNPESTRDAIKRGTGITWKTVNKVIKDMVKRKLVEEVAKEKWRTGLQSRYYSITFIGLLNFITTVNNEKSIENAINRHKSLHRLFEFEELNLKKEFTVGGGEINIWVLYQLASFETVLQFQVITEGRIGKSMLFPLYLLGDGSDLSKDLFSFNFLVNLNVVRKSLKVNPNSKLYDLFREVLIRIRNGVVDLENFVENFNEKTVPC